MRKGKHTTMVCGSEAWTLTNKIIQKLQTTLTSVKGILLGIDRKRIKYIREKTALKDVIRRTKL